MSWHWVYCVQVLHHGLYQLWEHGSDDTPGIWSSVGGVTRNSFPHIVRCASWVGTSGPVSKVTHVIAVFSRTQELL